ncbi:MAG TPA: PIN domain-containing protein [Actinomycetota bacterium]
MLDTSVLVAAADRRDAAHRACADLIAGWAGPLFVPVLVAGEAAWMIERRAGLMAEYRFIAELAAGSLTVGAIEPGDWLRIGELVERYGDLRLGTVDASIVSLAERLGITTIATLDHRHFSVVRPAHTDRFTLMP